MTLDAPCRVDDLTAQEAATVVRAYETGLVHEDHDDAFSLAMGVFRAFRPDLPLSIIASELEMLLTCTTEAGAPYVFCE
ncbi:hypothetical protein [Azospirillum sp. sgz301742]